MTVQLQEIDLDHPDVFCALAQFQHAGYIDQSKLQQALELNGVPKEHWPKPPTNHVCLGRAMREAAGRNDRVEPIADGWVLTKVLSERLDLEDPGNDGTNAHEVCVTAKVIVAGDQQQLRITPISSPHAALIRHEYEHQQGLFKASEDISRWLSQTVIPLVRGVAAKSRGGAYYIAKGSGLTTFRKVKAALDSVSKFNYRAFPCDHGPDVQLPIVVTGTHVILKPEFAAMDAVRIMLNGLIEECDRTCTDLQAKLQADNLGKRALATQIKRADELADKVENYASVLGLNLTEITVRLEELQSHLGISMACLTDD